MYDIEAVAVGVGIVGILIGFAAGYATAWGTAARLRERDSLRAYWDGHDDGVNSGYNAGLNAFDPATGRRKPVQGTAIPETRYQYRGGSILPEERK